MKTRNQFDRLSSEDPQFIHQLSDTYAKACEILEQPRRDSLNLEATASTDQNPKSTTPDSAILQNAVSKKPEIAQIARNCSSAGTAINQKPNIPLL